MCPLRPSPDRPWWAVAHSRGAGAATVSDPASPGIGQNHDDGAGHGGDGVDSPVLFTGRASADATNGRWDSDHQLHLDPDLSSGLEDLVVMANAGVVAPRTGLPPGRVPPPLGSSR
jgi:hypothetical protein